MLVSHVTAGPSSVGRGHWGALVGAERTAAGGNTVAGATRGRRSLVAAASRVAPS